MLVGRQDELPAWRMAHLVPAWEPPPALLAPPSTLLGHRLCSSLASTLLPLAALFLRVTWIATCLTVLDGTWKPAEGPLRRYRESNSIHKGEYSRASRGTEYRSRGDRLQADDMQRAWMAGQSSRPRACAPGGLQRVLPPAPGCRASCLRRWAPEHQTSRLVAGHQRQPQGAPAACDGRLRLPGLPQPCGDGPPRHVPHKSGAV